MSKMIIADGDDWIGCYVDGELISEDHSFAPEDIVQIAIDYDVTEVEKKSVNWDWLADLGTLPQNISEVIWDGEDYESLSEVIRDEDYD